MLYPHMLVKNRINDISRKAMRRRLTLTAFDIDSLIDKSDRKLFRQVTQPAWARGGTCPHLEMLQSVLCISSYCKTLSRRIIYALF